MALLKTVGLCKYFGGLKAVNHVVMEVQQGQIFGIIGPNGAGKTTFFNLCAGLSPPRRGEIWFDGKNITGYRPHMAAKAGIARTFQNIQLFPERPCWKTLQSASTSTQHQYAGCRFGQRTPEKHRKKSTKKARRCWSVWSWGNTKDTLAKPALRHPAQGGNCPCAGNFPQNSAVGRTRSRYEPERNPRAAFVCKKAERRGANGGRH